MTLRTYDFKKETISALANCRTPYGKIGEGVGVSRSWLHKILNGEIENPGIRDLQKLHDWLLEQKQNQKPKRR